jgi:hypothetical protein
VRDLLSLLVVLRLGVLQHLLGLARATQRVEGTLRQRSSAARDVRRGCGHGLGARQVRAGLRRAAELLDAALQLLGVILRLTQVLL